MTTAEEVAQIKVALLVIVSPVVAWLVASPCIFIWWWFNRDSRKRISATRPGLVMLIDTSTFFSLTSLLVAGFHQVLFFLPDESSTNDDGGGLRIHVSATLGVGLAFFFLIELFLRIEELRARSERLALIEEVDRRRRDLRARSLDGLIKKREEIEAQIQAIYTKRPPVEPGRPDELTVLHWLREEIDWRIEDLQRRS